MANKLQDFYDTNKNTKEIKKGEIIFATIVGSDRDNVYLDIGIKSETPVDRSEFKEEPKEGEKVSVLVKKAPSNEDSHFILSKKEAEEQKNWIEIQDSFDKNYQISGTYKSEVKNKGYIFDVKGFDFFLPVSQISIKKSSVSKGASFEFKIIRLDASKKTGIISYNKLIEEINDEKWDNIKSKYEVGQKVTVKVNEVISFGVFCMFEGIRGLLHHKDMSYKKNIYYREFKDKFQPEQELEVVILEINQEKNHLFFGLKQLEEDPWIWAEKELTPGTVIRGTVVSIVKFGAFIELKEGLEGLVHNSEISWLRKNQNAKSRLKKKQIVEAYISEIDADSRKLSLSIKKNEQNPWDTLSSNVRINNVLEGKVTKQLDYGVFVEVEDEIEGLVHISDMSWEENIKKTDFPAVGENIQYKILSINKENQKISCGLKQLIKHPYEIIKENFPYGTIIEVSVSNVADFGVFVDFYFEDKKYTGLIPNAEIDEEAKSNLEKETILKVCFVKVSPLEKRITFSLKRMQKAMEKAEMDKYISKENSPIEESLGNLVSKKDEKI